MVPVGPETDGKPLRGPVEERVRTRNQSKIERPPQRMKLLWWNDVSIAKTFRASKTPTVHNGAASDLSDISKLSAVFAVRHRIVLKE